MKKAKEFAKELEEKWDKKPKKHFFGRMIDQIRTDKKAFIVYLILRAIVIAVKRDPRAVGERVHRSARAASLYASAVCGKEFQDYAADDAGNSRVLLCFLRGDSR